MNLEELVACGVGEVIEVGTCGSIISSVLPGSVLVVDRAFSDEGTSKHYFSRRKTFSASRELTGRLSKELAPFGSLTGAVWTTDGPYRETRRKVAAFRARGAAGVNMESSALFAVAEYRGVQIASAQVISDTVTEDRSRPAFHRETVRRSVETATRAASKALAAGEEKP